MKPATLSMVATILCKVSIVEAQSLTTADVGRFADSAFADYLRYSPAPSLAFVVVKDGTVLFARGYGYEDATSQQPVDPDSTVFWMALLSKLITADAVLREVERGGLALDAPVERYLGWRLPSRAGWPPVSSISSPTDPVWMSRSCWVRWTTPRR